MVAPNFQKGTPLLCNAKVQDQIFFSFIAEEKIKDFVLILYDRKYPTDSMRLSLAVGKNKFNFLNIPTVCKWKNWACFEKQEGKRIDLFQVGRQCLKILINQCYAFTVIFNIGMVMES